MVLHQKQTVRVNLLGKTYMVKVPTRKTVECRTRDLHQSLLVKLNRAVERNNGRELPDKPLPRSRLHSDETLDQVKLNSDLMQNTEWGGRRGEGQTEPEP